ncbi:MAG: T9SS type A sorting domain-containing protein [Flavobacteriales bacterium]|nr:T9SS type A sorting domain-containing protein [Flavobacteriales bacterium]MCB9173491.1 T9SS type A sorting domain-containing protein [Flavobacteriales bacterium]
MNKLLTFILLLSFTSVAIAQKDTLVELGYNKKLISQSYQQENLSIFKNDFSSKKALTLPFIDDFSQQHYYPDASKWENNNVYINSSYPVNPPSYGVATFDGLDSTGYPYNFLVPTAHGIADYLTSKVIDLTVVTDSVFLSFYYQPQGIGNLPQSNDSLRLDFFRKSDSTWVRKWAVPGSTLAPFKKVMVAVDTSFHNDAFQFRFVNYATLSGNVDHWHLDYVYLNDNRNHADTVLNDVAFTGDFYNMLNVFTAMPYTHYKLDSTNNMATAINVEYKNNSDTTRFVFYKYEVIEDNGNGATIETYPSGTSSQPAPFYSSLNVSQAVNDITNNDFYFPVDTAQTKVYQIKNYFTLSNGSILDFNQNNDVVYSYQVFSNYYSYDDGSAEAGYGVLGINSKLANQFSIKMNDTLIALDIYFNPVTYNLSAKTFKLKIWSSLNPEIVLYEQVGYYNPIYSFTNEFLKYNLDYPIYLPAGTYYFGYENITEDYLTVGYDLNNNNRTKIYKNVVGVWENSSYDGTLMIHPVFKYLDAIVSVNENIVNDSKINIYPNPSSGKIYFNNTSIQYEIHVFDMYGKIVFELPKGNHKDIDLSNLPNGVYLIKLSNENQSQIDKIIIYK